jgi:hypothetical protein
MQVLEANDIFPSLGEALASDQFSQLRAVIQKIENTEPNPPLSKLIEGISGTLALPNNQVCAQFQKHVIPCTCGCLSVGWSREVWQGYRMVQLLQATLERAVCVLQQRPRRATHELSSYVQSDRQGATVVTFKSEQCDQHKSHALAQATAAACCSFALTCCRQAFQGVNVTDSNSNTNDMLALQTY